MFTFLWFLLIALLATLSISFILDHNGSVIINWLGYEVRSDVITTFLLALFFSFLVLILSYFLARILALKFPNLYKILFKKSYVKKLEAIISKHSQGLDVLSELLLSLESDNVKNSQDLQRKLASLIKNPNLNNFFLGKIAYQNHDYVKAVEYFSKLDESKFSKFMIIKSKFKLALKAQDNASAIAYGKQILSVKSDSFKTAKILLSLYRKTGLWQEAKALINEYGASEFQDELQKKELTFLNLEIAYDYYKKRNFKQAIKHAKISLKYDENFVPAIEILLKSFIKRGCSFYAKYKIKKFWQKNPHLVLAEIYDFLNRKKSKESRLKAIKKLSYISDNRGIGSLSCGLLALRLGMYLEAKKFLNLSLLSDKNFLVFQALSRIEKHLNNLDLANEYAKKALELESKGRYSCGICHSKFLNWHPNCSVCGSNHGLEWNN